MVLYKCTETIINYGTPKERWCRLQKSFKLAEDTTSQEFQRKLQELNNFCEKWNLSFETNKKTLVIKSKKKKVGRPVEHTLDYQKILKMQQNGLTNKEIYTSLGMSKTRFYVKLREYRNANNNMEQCKGVK